MNLDKIFHLKERNTNVKTEIVAGITMFMTMAYILAVNPSILSASGMDSGAVFTATAIASAVGTILMAVFSNHPFALAPAMGLNAYFAYTVVLGMGYSWQQALAAIFVEGIIFIILSVTNVREAIFNAIPTNLKHGVSVGIGFFITFIGLQNAKIVVNNDSTLVDMFSFSASISDGSFSSVGISVVLALVGTLITAVFMVKKIKGGILWGVLATWALGMICQLAGIYVPNPEAGFYSLFPDFSNGLAVPSMAPTFMQIDFSIMKTFDFFIIMFAFLFVDVFDTMGTLIGVASQADLLDKDGKLPKNTAASGQEDPSDINPLDDEQRVNDNILSMLNEFPKPEEALFIQPVHVFSDEAYRRPEDNTVEVLTESEEDEELAFDESAIEIEAIEPTGDHYFKDGVCDTGFIEKQQEKKVAEKAGE